MKLTVENKNEIRDIVAASFETGHLGFDSYEDFRREYPKLGKAGWEYYCELVNLGPAGFYEEFKDVYDFDPDFIAEYAPYYEDDEYDEDEEEDFIDSTYHDYSEEELRAMDAFDNLNDEEEF